MTAALGELCKITVGRTPARAKPEYWGQGHPWLSIADMNQGLNIRKTKEQITELGATGGRPIDPGTVLLSFKLTIGKVAIADIPLYTNEAIAALPIMRPAHLDSRYLLRALQAMDLSTGSNRAAMGATLNQRSLSCIEIPLPSLPEQRRIAAILDHADALRAKRRQVLAYLNALTQSVFHEMFGKVRGTISLAAALDSAPVFTDGDWVKTKDQDPAGSVRLTQLADVGDGRWVDKSSRYLTSDTAKRLRCTYLAEGDVLVGRMPDPLGRACIFPGSEQSCVTVVDVCVIRIDPLRHNATWLSAAINGPDARAQMLRMATGTTRSRISRGNLGRVTIPNVGPPEQAEFARSIGILDQRRHGSDYALTLLDSLFEALQSRAFRGEL